jgi:hypothetical protein
LIYQKTNFGNLFDQTYHIFENASQHQREKDLALGISLIGIRIANKRNAFGCLTNIASKILEMSFESIGRLFRAYGMFNQNIEENRHEWSRITSNDDIKRKLIHGIEGVKIAEASDLIIEAVGLLMQPTIRELKQ